MDKRSKKFGKYGSHIKILGKMLEDGGRKAFYSCTIKVGWESFFFRKFIIKTFDKDLFSYSLICWLNTFFVSNIRGTCQFYPWNFKIHFLFYLPRGLENDYKWFMSYSNYSNGWLIDVR